jgi:ATPase subunit of ABC transporter with duplicated ATPase domains
MCLSLSGGFALQPTNDLGIETLEIVHEMLTTDRSAVLVVSPARDFFDGIVTPRRNLNADRLPRWCSATLERWRLCRRSEIKL